MLVSQELFDETLLESQELFEYSDEDAVKETISELQSSSSSSSSGGDSNNTNMTTIRLDHLSLTHPKSQKGKEDRAKQAKFVKALKDKQLAEATEMIKDAAEKEFPSFMSIVLQSGFFGADTVSSLFDDTTDVSLVLQFTLALLQSPTAAVATTSSSTILFLAREIKLQLARPLQEDWCQLYDVSESSLSMRRLLLDLVKWARCVCNACESNKKTFMRAAIEYRPKQNDDADTGLIMLVESLPKQVNEDTIPLIGELSKLITILGKFQAASEPQPKDGEEPLVSSGHANVKELYRIGAVNRLHALAKQCTTAVVVVSDNNDDDDDDNDENNNNKNKQLLLCDLLSALRVMAIDNDIVQNMVAVGILETVDASLWSATKISAPLAAATLGLIRNLCANDEIKSNVCKKSLSAILHVMETHDSNHTVQEHGCGILGAMALRQPRNAISICDANGAHYILKAMQRFPDKVPLQRQGCLALRNIAARLTVEQRQVILDAGAENVLKTVPAMHQGSVEEAYAALRDLGITAVMYKYDENGQAQTTQLFGTVKSNFRAVYE